MILYLLKSALCLLVLLLVYRLLLQREAIYKFNRFYLLAAVLGSFLIPLVEMEVTQEVTQAPVLVVGEGSQVQLDQAVNEVEFTSSIPNESIEAEKPMDWKLILLGVYVLVTLVFLIRFIRNIHLLFDKIHRNVHVQFRGETLVLLPENSLPFSFLSYIFVSGDYFQSGQLTDSVFAHEQAHVRGRHSWDNLLIEGLLVIFWFHPGLYLSRQAIKLNHEFIADAAALQITPLEHYKTFLLAMMLPDQNQGLVSSLNFSLTKKRFEMMKRKTTNSTKVLKILLVLPVLAALVYFFSEKVTLDKELSSSDQAVYQQGPSVHSTGIEENLKSTQKSNKDTTEVFTIKLGMPFQLLTKAEYYSETKFIVKDTDGNSQEYSYEELAENYKRDLPGPPGALKKNMPSSDLFESWKNGDEFAIWIDDKVAPNSELGKMEVSDVAHYQSSFVHANARSARFPQKYQVRIYTFSGFERSYGKDSNFGKKPMGGTVTFNSATSKNKPISGISSQESNDHQPPTSEKYTRQVTEFQLKISNAGIFTSPSDAEISALQAEFQEMETTYFNLSMDERRKVKRAGFPFAKIEKDGQIRYRKFEFLTSEERKALAC